MKTDLITVFQDNKTCLSGFESHFDNINSFKNIIGDNNLTLEINGNLTFKNYVGFISKQNTNLQILPKIYSNDSQILVQDEIKKSLEFLYRILYWSGYLQIKELDITNIDIDDNNLLEIFIKIFINHFLKKYEKYLYYQYIINQSNESFIKGKILFSKSLKYNFIAKHKHYLEYEEFTINNILNRILKTTIKNLLFISQNLNNKKLLRKGIQLFEEVDYIILTKEIFNSIIFTRLNNEYKPLINLAHLFYLNLQPGISFGNENTYSFLVQLNLLFENFIFKMLQEICRDLQIKVKYHDNKYLGKDQKENDVFQLQPDFIFIMNHKTTCILDTKFKYPFNESNEVSINHQDLYQLITYAVCYKCNNLILIYPKFKGVKNQNILLERIFIPSNIGEIILKVIQVDITHDNLDTIKQELNLGIFK